MVIHGGAGTYANNLSCAVSGTGDGEFFIRNNVAADICARVRYGRVSLQQAADDVVMKNHGQDLPRSMFVALESVGRD